MSPRGIPVVMYHSVGRDRPDWIWNYLITPVEVFEGQMRILRDAGWKTIPLALLHSHMAEGTPVPERSVVLTFDDGYLDNWIYAFPILRKFGHRAVIWTTTDFVDPRTDPRPTLDDVWSKRLREEAIDPRGFLSWAEMREMVASGLVEIQSHAKTHTWYFSGPEILDFHRPRGIDGYICPPWLEWNCYPENKHLSLTASKADQIPYGTPIYEYGKSLVVRRYFEDRDLTAGLVHTVKEGGAGFFNSKGWRDSLRDVVKEHGTTNGRTETDEEYVERAREEIAGSRHEIERHLGTAVRFLCWPGGGHNEVTLRIAREAGYLATTTHYEDPGKHNIFGDDPGEINRIGSGSPCLWRGKMLRRTDPEFFMAGLRFFAGDRKSLWTLRRLKVKYFLRQRFTGRE